jgi:hypothetical protein
MLDFEAVTLTMVGITPKEEPAQRYHSGPYFANELRAESVFWR